MIIYIQIYNGGDGVPGIPGLWVKCFPDAGFIDNCGYTGCVWCVRHVVCEACGA